MDYEEQPTQEKHPTQEDEQAASESGAAAQKRASNGNFQHVFPLPSKAATERSKQSQVKPIETAAKEHVAKGWDGTPSVSKP